jgi:hypothetical protein
MSSSSIGPVGIGSEKKHMGGANSPRFAPESVEVSNQESDSLTVDPPRNLRMGREDEGVRKQAGYIVQATVRSVANAGFFVSEPWWFKLSNTQLLSPIFKEKQGLWHACIA